MKDPPSELCQTVRCNVVDPVENSIRRILRFEDFTASCVSLSGIKRVWAVLNDRTVSFPCRGYPIHMRKLWVGRKRLHLSFSVTVGVESDYITASVKSNIPQLCYVFQSCLKDITEYGTLYRIFVRYLVMLCIFLYVFEI